MALSSFALPAIKSACCMLGSPFVRLQSTWIAAMPSAPGCSWFGLTHVRAALDLSWCSTLCF